ncbi:MAG: hypothetical protein CSYNP_03378 [Syntrophus sp. SKADARSKE-3]|nr:hypothetical protein [Syntrophus sp. SKADARSKE-3]
MSGTILVISSDTNIANTIQEILAGLGEIIVVSHLRSAFDTIYNDIPNLLIVDMQGNRDDASLLYTLKEDPLFAHLPVLVILGEEELLPDWTVLPAEDYIRPQDIQSDLRSRVQLCAARSARIVEVNPLTRLPGNISINRQIQDRLDQGIPFALAYADLDYFKPFNDKYGFSRGDEVIKITGRLMLNIVRNKSSRNTFIGHVGGDDFICIMDPSFIEEACQELIDAFDQIVPSFYDPDDREKGCIQSKSREGHAQKYPIMGISIGIATTEAGVFTHFGEVTSVASEMKSFAKKKTGSCYRTNKRTYA